MKLPQEFKEKWIAALRSGKYKQAQESLFSGIYDDENDTSVIGYCCLGVACKVAGISDDDMSGHPYPSDLGPSHQKNLPELLLEHGGYFSTITSFEEQKNEVSKLMHMNDVQEKSFPEIADYIEQNL